MAFLAATAKQDDNAFAVFAEVDPVTGFEIDLALIYTGADPFDVREIPLPKAVQGHGDPCGSLSIEAVESARKRRLAS